MQDSNKPEGGDQKRKQVKFAPPRGGAYYPVFAPGGGAFLRNSQNSSRPVSNGSSQNDPFHLDDIANRLRNSGSAVSPTSSQNPAAGAPYKPSPLHQVTAADEVPSPDSLPPQATDYDFTDKAIHEYKELHKLQEASNLQGIDDFLDTLGRNGTSKNYIKDQIYYYTKDAERFTTINEYFRELIKLQSQVIGTAQLAHAEAYGADRDSGKKADPNDFTVKVAGERTSSHTQQTTDRFDISRAKKEADAGVVEDEDYVKFYNAKKNAYNQRKEHWRLFDEILENQTVIKEHLTIANGFSAKKHPFYQEKNSLRTQYQGVAVDFNRLRQELLAFKEQSKTQMQRFEKQCYTDVSPLTKPGLTQHISNTSSKDSINPNSGKSSVNRISPASSRTSVDRNSVNSMESILSYYRGYIVSESTAPPETLSSIATNAAPFAQRSSDSLTLPQHLPGSQDPRTTQAAATGNVVPPNSNSAGMAREASNVSAPAPGRIRANMPPPQIPKRARPPGFTVSQDHGGRYPGAVQTPLPQELREPPGAAANSGTSFVPQSIDYSTNQRTTQNQGLKRSASTASHFDWDKPTLTDRIASKMRGLSDFDSRRVHNAGRHASTAARGLKSGAQSFFDKVRDLGNKMSLLPHKEVVEIPQQTLIGTPYDMLSNGLPPKFSAQKLTPTKAPYLPPNAPGRGLNDSQSISEQSPEAPTQSPLGGPYQNPPYGWSSYFDPSPPLHFRGSYISIQEAQSRAGKTKDRGKSGWQNEANQHLGRSNEEIKTPLQDEKRWSAAINAQRKRVRETFMRGRQSLNNSSPDRRNSAGNER